VDPAEEAHLGTVLVAHAREVVLVQQRLTDAAAGVSEQSAPRLRPVPVLVEHVGAQVGHPFVVLVGPEHLDQAEGMADDLDGSRVRGAGQLEHDPGGVAGFAPPVTGQVHRPCPLHLEVGVQDPLAELHEQVFAVGPHPVDGLPGEVDERDRRHAQ